MKKIKIKFLRFVDQAQKNTIPNVKTTGLECDWTGVSSAKHIDFLLVQIDDV